MIRGVNPDIDPHVKVIVYIYTTYQVKVIVSIYTTYQVTAVSAVIRDYLYRSTFP